MSNVGQRHKTRAIKQGMMQELLTGRSPGLSKSREAVK